MICIDNSEWMRNDDYSLSRFEAQARAHRLGQKKDVLVLRFETVQTVEEQVRASAEHKLAVANQSITVGFFDKIQAHGDKFAAKRMRRLTQRRAVDYTSTVVRYMQELQFHQTPLLQFLLLPICRIPWLQLLVLLQTH
ncbi:hypothetical protein ES319_A01G112800v1 [Gossypium barbadense]|uniref:Uncharacterized protein n=1 Tax=Gossypium barbadense TaxID=3634 RepID=A0A5J5WVY8_GOSBA|nr:hypothetical protein ES319_A01G112800v1 [Gossypium barbadense]